MVLSLTTTMLTTCCGRSFISSLYACSTGAKDAYLRTRQVPSCEIPRVLRPTTAKSVSPCMPLLLVTLAEGGTAYAKSPAPGSSARSRLAAVHVG